MTAFTCLGEGCIRAHQCWYAFDQPHNDSTKPPVNVQANGCGLFRTSPPPADLPITPVGHDQGQQDFPPPA